MDFSDSIWSAAVVLLFIMDPLGNIPVMLSILKDIDPARRQKIIVRELFIALAILLIFLFSGQKILDFLHLQQESVTIAGGIVLLIIGLRMIFPNKEGVMGHSAVGGEPFIVPLAVPMIAGPSALAMLILMVRSAPGQMTNWFYALMIAWALTSVALLGAPLLYRVLRDRGLAAIERLMGMLLVMMAVQMLLNGLKAVG
ncbi:MAG: YhgN family NAAT transporter [Rhodothermales bacterium]